MTDHDATYHRLFAPPEMVRELMVGFVDAPWIEALDFAAMERINAKFHGPGEERRDGDVIWRIPMRGGPDVYLYVLLEFQSTPERWMALRVLVYVGLLWQQLIAERRLTADGRLPPVFPIVLYNGDGRWRAPLTLAELVALTPDSTLWPWQPSLRYHLIDEGSYSAAALAAGTSLAAMLFELEQATDPDAMLPAIDRLVEWFRRHPATQELQRTMVALIEAGYFAGKVSEPTLATGLSLQEMRNMLATRMKEWQDKVRRDSLEQGRLAGLEAGRQEGAALVLRHLLERKFGPLAPAVLARLGSADAETLESWSLRVLDAHSADEVLR